MEQLSDPDLSSFVGYLPAGPSHAPGDRIAGRYQLIRVLDRGGMGVVWIAHHLTLDVHVALKLIRPDAGSDEAARRLVQEAQVAARIDHPAVLRVLDVGRTADDDPFLVMELLEGESLADVLRRERRLAPVVAVRTILPIAEALSILHEKGIVHRDVKPENIFLAQSDSGRWQPKLIDFGAVKLRERSSRSRISNSGVTVGTPIYMSFEQLQGADVDARSDLFALSVVLYEAITGAPPFNRESISTLVTELFADDPRSFADHGIVDPELWAIVRRGLARHAQRWSSARDLFEALARWLRARGATADIGDVALRTGRINAAEVRRARREAPASPPRATRPPAPSEPPSARSPLAITLGVAVPAPADGAPPVARRRSPRRHLALGLSALVAGAGLIAAKLSAGGPLPVPPSPPVSTSLPAPPPPPAAPPPSPSASALPRLPPSPRAAPRPRAVAIPPELKDPYR